MKRSEIRAKVEGIIQDASYSSVQIDDYINQALLHTAGEVNLPDLKRLGTVQTVAGQPYTTLTGLTGGFSGKLVKVHSTTIRIYKDLDALLSDYISSTNKDLLTAGAVEAVALEGSTLWYQYVPAVAESIILTYYRNPTKLTGDNDVPSIIPEELHFRLLVNGTCWMIYNEIEDGEEDTKVNTGIHFDQSFNWDNKHSGINSLRAWVSRNKVPHVSSNWSV